MGSIRSRRVTADSSLSACLRDRTPWSPGTNRRDSSARTLRRRKTAASESCSRFRRLPLPQEYAPQNEDNRLAQFGEAHVPLLLCAAVLDLSYELRRGQSCDHFQRERRTEGLPGSFADSSRQAQRGRETA